MYAIPLPLFQQLIIVLTLMFTSNGIAWVPGVSMVVLTVNLVPVGLPIEGSSIILGIRLIPVSNADQLKFGINFLTLGNKKIVVVEGVSNDYK